MTVFEQTIHALHKQLSAGSLKASELIEAVLARCDAVEPQVRAYISLTPDLAREQAAAADAAFARGDIRSPLQGIPLALKDNLCTQGIVTTCASHMLESFVPPYDATVIQRLREAGAVMVGKANMDEFAMGSSTENSYFVPTRNPWGDLEYVPGGSSGGSAAAVAADMCIAALGSDTGGSIRLPAAMTGVVGLKPTYGRVSRFGLVAFASSLDQIGPLTKDVRDAAMVLQAIAGHDPCDSTSGDVPVPDYSQGLERGVRGLKLGVPREYFVEGMDPGVEASVRTGIATLKSLGAELVDISLPHTRYAVATYYVLANAEASSNLARYDGVRYGLRTAADGDLLSMYKQTRAEGFGPEVKRRIMLGTYALSSGYYDAYYKKAQQVRTLLRQDFQQAFTECDALLSPVAPTPAFRLGERLDDPLQMYLADIFTAPVSLAGLPAMSVPCGYTQQDSLPIGLQIIAPPFQEDVVLQVGAAFEAETDFHTRKPVLPE
ncbi:Asp-tRNA(Asn)/Glu-tRNA(Gln) amidotransferase subunit GatA [Candidatus Entotheonella palauensis]|uniref:Asp-tRNA(Asn)/Glu-tRNA(Gln) amidotransferase subunit GatA n=1 Tax=Candidatus Entotheonella palauensis TaxID=93172 RepID=UPI000B7F6394|nr:Asp-tRNA(Asn)/Glu-tRNA(Gln) amidotransferase subunit GatA [Candidatus Entotheonella palauensis]